MNESIKIKDKFIDSSCITHNRKKLNEILDSENEGIDFQDNVEVATNEFLNGKRIYTKRFVTNSVLNNNSIRIKHGITNFDRIWVDLSNSYYYRRDVNRSVPVVSPFYIEDFSSREGQTVTIEAEEIIISSNGGFNENWEKVITVKYTKK